MIIKTPLICPSCGEFIGYAEDFIHYAGVIRCGNCGWEQPRFVYQYRKYLNTSYRY